MVSRHAPGPGREIGDSPQPSRAPNLGPCRPVPPGRGETPRESSSAPTTAEPAAGRTEGCRPSTRTSSAAGGWPAGQPARGSSFSSWILQGLPSGPSQGPRRLYEPLARAPWRRVKASAMNPSTVSTAGGEGDQLHALKAIIRCSGPAAKALISRVPAISCQERQASRPLQARTRPLAGPRTPRSRR